MSIRRFSRLDPEVQMYLNHITIPSSEIDRFLYTAYPYTRLSKRASFLTIGTPIQGVVALRPEQLHKTAYQRIQLIHADDDQLLTQLTKGLLDHHHQQSRYRGLFTSPLLRTNRVANPILLEAGFRIERRWRHTTPSQLKTKTKPDHQLTAVKFTRSNKATLRRLFITLLAEHDNQVNHLSNLAFGQRLLPTNLHRSKVHQVKLSYFVEEVATSNQWHAFILFINDQPIGFIKAQVDREHLTTSIDLYLRPKYRQHSSGAYNTLANSLITARAKAVQLGTYESDDDQKKQAASLFGNIRADQYFYLD